MKKILSTLVLILLICPFGTAIGAEKSLTFEWTANTESDMKQYVLYNRIEGQGYDYNIPIKIIPCTIADGKCTTTPPSADGDCTVTITQDVPDGQKIINHFIVRAEDIYENQSGDSNEVSYTSDLTPLVAINDFVGVFNKVAQTVDFSWTQNDIDRVTSWKLYRTITSGSNYTQVGNAIPWNGTDTDISASVSADTLAPGEEYYFVVVAFGDAVNSPNSNEVKIDRKPPTKRINLKITVLP
jgi:hypothetical protein